MKKSKARSRSDVREKPVSAVFSYVLLAICSVSVAAAGLFFEWSACAASVVLSVYLLIFFIKNKKLTVKRDLSFISVAVIVVAHLFAVIYAVDRGLALIGFLKFLPVVLFFLCIMQDPGFKPVFEKYFPLFVCALSAVTSILFFIPATKSAVSVDGRLHGLTQYPNAFAIILLVSELILLKNDKWYLKFPGIVVLAAGLFLTGCRAVMILALISNLAILIHGFKKNKKAVLITLGAIAAVAAFSVTLGTFGISPFDRILKINLNDSTLWCRILYFSDAAPYIFRHPFGIGYLGYNFVQTTFQTGIYNIRFIHNDVLQTALDVGWVPAVLFCVAAVHAIVRKGRSFTDRAVAAVILAHSLFDFDLQFLSVAFIFSIYLLGEPEKEITFRRRPAAFSVFPAVAAVSAYFAVALAFGSLGNPAVSLAMYPANTECKVQVLLTAETEEELDERSDAIIAGNEYVPLAYTAKARAAYYRLDFRTVAKYKQKVFKLTPFSYDEYEEYCKMLLNGAVHYYNNGDQSNVQYCFKELNSAVDKYKEVLGTMSYAGWMTKKPVEEFPEEIMQYYSDTAAN